MAINQGDQILNGVGWYEGEYKNGKYKLKWKCKWEIQMDMFSGMGDGSEGVARPLPMECFLMNHPA